LINTEYILKFPIGYSREGLIYLALDDGNPHLLIAGATGSGKSVCLRSIITTIILTKDKSILKLHCADMKAGAEFGIFKRSDFIESYCITVDEVIQLLNNLKSEMYNRLQSFEKIGVVNIDGYNKKSKVKIPYHLFIVDEFKNIKMNNTAECLVDEITRMSRVVGIHMILSTQRPDAETLPGEIKANFTSTIAFKTRNEINSRILLDNEKLHI